MTAPEEPDFVTATREAYDTVAANYARLAEGLLDENPFDRAVLTLFAELVQGAPDNSGDRSSTGRVAEIGCGPGRITAHLAKLGLDIFGLDLSPAMVEESQRYHPELEFRVGDMTQLDLEPGSLAGLVAWYSLIHVPPAGQAAVLARFRRALALGGHLLVAFHAGDERRHITDAYGHSGLSCDSYLLPPERVEREAVAAGFVPVARLVREPRGPEKTAQAYLVMRAGDGVGAGAEDGS